MTSEFAELVVSICDGITGLWRMMSAVWLILGGGVGLLMWRVGSMEKRLNALEQDKEAQ